MLLLLNTIPKSDYSARFELIYVSKVKESKLVPNYESVTKGKHKKTRHGTEPILAVPCESYHVVRILF